MDGCITLVSPPKARDESSWWGGTGTPYKSSKRFGKDLGKGYELATLDRHLGTSEPNILFNLAAAGPPGRVGETFAQKFPQAPVSIRSAPTSVHLGPIPQSRPSESPAILTSSCMQDTEPLRYAEHTLASTRGPAHCPTSTRVTRSSSDETARGGRLVENASRREVPSRQTGHTVEEVLDHGVAGRAKPAVDLRGTGLVLGRRERKVHSETARTTQGTVYAPRREFPLRQAGRAVEEFLDSSATGPAKPVVSSSLAAPQGATRAPPPSSRLPSSMTQAASNPTAKVLLGGKPGPGMEAREAKESSVSKDSVDTGHIHESLRISEPRFNAKEALTTTAKLGVAPIASTRTSIARPAVLADERRRRDQKRLLAAVPRESLATVLRGWDGGGSVDYSQPVPQHGSVHPMAQEERVKHAHAPMERFTVPVSLMRTIPAISHKKEPALTTLAVEHGGLHLHNPKLEEGALRISQTTIGNVEKPTRALRTPRTCHSSIPQPTSAFLAEGAAKYSPCRRADDTERQQRAVEATSSGSLVKTAGQEHRDCPPSIPDISAKGSCKGTAASAAETQAAAVEHEGPKVLAHVDVPLRAAATQRPSSGQSRASGKLMTDFAESVSVRGRWQVLEDAPPIASACSPYTPPARYTVPTLHTTLHTAALDPRNSRAREATMARTNLSAEPYRHFEELYRPRRRDAVRGSTSNGGMALLSAGSVTLAFRMFLKKIGLPLPLRHHWPDVLLQGGLGATEPRYLRSISVQAYWRRQRLGGSSLSTASTSCASMLTDESAYTISPSIRTSSDTQAKKPVGPFVKLPIARSHENGGLQIDSEGSDKPRTSNSSPYVEAVNETKEKEGVLTVRINARTPGTMRASGPTLPRGRIDKPSPLGVFSPPSGLTLPASRSSARACQGSRSSTSVQDTGCAGKRAQGTDEAAVRPADVPSELHQPGHPCHPVLGAGPAHLVLLPARCNDARSMHESGGLEESPLANGPCEESVLTVEGSASPTILRILACERDFDRISICAASAPLCFEPGGLKESSARKMSDSEGRRTGTVNACLLSNVQSVSARTIPLPFPCPPPAVRRSQTFVVSEHTLESVVLEDDTSARALREKSTLAFKLATGDAANMRSSALLPSSASRAPSTDVAGGKCAVVTRSDEREESLSGKALRDEIALTLAMPAVMQSSTHAPLSAPHLPGNGALKSLALPLPVATKPLPPLSRTFLTLESKFEEPRIVHAMRASSATSRGGGVSEAKLRGLNRPSDWRALERICWGGQMLPDCEESSARTFEALICEGFPGVVELCTVPPSLRSLLSSWARRSFTLVSAISRTFWFSHLRQSLVGERAPCREWAREGIGTGCET
ncbi:hypothetical protein C8R47DRAFT_1082126 [Mycena vitilis]|nr:hypothetical protein C8R47DRAFT_1082126 [Mycena vitilis]